MIGKKSLRTICTIVLLLSIQVILNAEDDAEVSATVDRTNIQENENLTYSISVSGSTRNISEPKLPAIEGFQVTSTGRSTNFSIVNGRMSSSVEFTYALTPLQTGTFTIGEAEITIKDKVYKTRPITIEVSKASQQNSYTQPPPSQIPVNPFTPFERRSTPKESLKNAIFVDAAVDKNEAFVNEQITLTFRFYSRINLLREPNYTPPSTEGFWTEDLPPQNKYYKIINGQKYLVFELKTALFPTRPGTFTISPATLECAVSRGSSDFFGFFDQPEIVTVKSDPIPVKVLPLPEKSPPGFGGSVGEFTLGTDVDKTRVEVNEPINLKIIIQGQGNMKVLPDLDLSTMTNFKIYDSESNVQLKVENYKVKGQKKFDRVIVPLKEGQLEIPALEFSYFSPETKKYYIAKTKPIPLEILPSSRKDAAPIMGLTKQEIKLLDRDIEFIAIAPELLIQQGNILYKKPLYLLSHFLVLLLFAGALIYRQQKVKMYTDQAYARQKNARKKAQNRLREVRSLFKQEKSGKEISDAISRAIFNFLGDQLNLSAAGLNTLEVIEELEKQGIDSITIINIQKLLETCDLIRFAGKSITKEEIEIIIMDAEKVLSILHEHLTKSSK